MPDGLKPLDMVAVSVTMPAPIPIDVVESKVATVGLALLTVRGSHELVAPLLFESPL